MDIEGSEARALTGGKGLIQRFGPKLAIAVYHAPLADEIPQWITVPQLVLGLRPTYRVAVNKSREEAFFYEAPAPKPAK